MQTYIYFKSFPYSFSTNHSYTRFGLQSLFTAFRIGIEVMFMNKLLRRMRPVCEHDEEVVVGDRILCKECLQLRRYRHQPLDQAVLEEKSSLF